MSVTNSATVTRNNMPLIILEDEKGKKLKPSDLCLSQFNNYCCFQWERIGESKNNDGSFDQKERS